MIHEVLPFEEWVRNEAAAIGTDGCSKVTNIHGFCCLVHDLEYYYAKDAYSAYQNYRKGYVHPWITEDTAAQTQKGADAHLKVCIQSRSKFGMWSPLAWIRYWGVRWKAKGAWERHRERERAAAQRV